MRYKVSFSMRMNVSAKPEEKNISYNYPDKHSSECLL